MYLCNGNASIELLGSVLHKNDMSMTETDIILNVYRGLISLKKDDGIPVNLRPVSLIGTVQDDPFDCWIKDTIQRNNSNIIEVFHSGTLTTPDLIVRDKKSGLIIGIEVKKLIQKDNGKDPRGMTIDYNSCLPCGKAFVRVGEETRIIPCYYLFALLNPTSTKIVSLILLDGDFLNYDFELYKEAKYANTSEYNHGPYGEGSVRHRRMYTYPNPLNSKISEFYLRMILIVKKHDMEMVFPKINVSEQIVRTDKYNNSFFYSLIDEASATLKIEKGLVTLSGVFDACKLRGVKERVAYIPIIPSQK